MQKKKLTSVLGSNMFFSKTHSLGSPIGKATGTASGEASNPGAAGNIDCPLAGSGKTC